MQVKHDDREHRTKHDDPVFSVVVSCFKLIAWARMDIDIPTI